MHAQSLLAARAVEHLKHIKRACSILYHISWRQIAMHGKLLALFLW